MIDPEVKAEAEFQMYERMMQSNKPMCFEMRAGKRKSKAWTGRTDMSLTKIRKRVRLDKRINTGRMLDTMLKEARRPTGSIVR